MNVVVLVPRRADGGHRDRVWSWLRARWARAFPTWPLHEGHHDDGPFNRGAAINLAATEAGDWDVAVIADADSLAAGTQQVVDAVDTAHRTGQVTYAHTRFRYLTPKASRMLMAGQPIVPEMHTQFTLDLTVSSMLAVPRPVFDAAGGFDERFEGWGFEDVAAHHAFDTFGGGHQRIAGDVLHLWHPVSDTNRSELPGYQANRERAERYAEAAGDPAAMRELIHAR